MKKIKVKDQFLAELRKIPIVQVAAEKTGVSRVSIYRWKKTDEEFSKAMEEALAEGEALVNDMTESQLLSMVKDREWAAVSFWLRHRHPKFKDKVEITAKIEKNEEMTPEQEALFKRAVGLSKSILKNKNHD